MLWCQPLNQIFQMLGHQAITAPSSIIAFDSVKCKNESLQSHYRRKTITLELIFLACCSDLIAVKSDFAKNKRAWIPLYSPERNYFKDCVPKAFARYVSLCFFFSLYRKSFLINFFSKPPGSNRSNCMHLKLRADDWGLALGQHPVTCLVIWPLGSPLSL